MKNILKESISMLIKEIEFQKLECNELKLSLYNLIDIINVHGEIPMKYHNNEIGKLYEKEINAAIKKKRGQVYTPEFIVSYINSITLNDVKVMDNPYVKIFDPSCGSGDFLIKAYDILFKDFTLNIKDLREKYKNEEFTVFNKVISGKEYFSEEYIHYHILKNCIYGSDIDIFSVLLCRINLCLKRPYDITEALNIVNEDSIIFKGKLELYSTKLSFKLPKINNNMLQAKGSKDFRSKYKIFNSSYDYIIGNPPYIGHKDMEIHYKNLLRKYYKEIYNDKGDISFCFLYKFSKEEYLKKKLCFVTSRYFLESVNGTLIRRYMQNNTYISKIFDFYGHRIFKAIGIDPVIITLEPLKNKVEEIDVTRVESNCKIKSYEEFIKGLKTGNNESLNKFKVKLNELQEEGWILQSHDRKAIINKIESKATLQLSDICLSFQGIITGCDKAFILHNQQIKFNIPKKLLKKWIKNSEVLPFAINYKGSSLIYSNEIKEENCYKEVLNYIENYKLKLSQRRECKKGYRKWYELQWGREASLFETPKIIYPYKCSENRFALDLQGYYFSADVYGLIPRSKDINLYTLTAILNSSLYEFYFKTYAKKLGENMYDYYPNKVLLLKIPDLKELDNLNYITKDIIEGNIAKEVELKIIDKYLFEYFNISKEEERIILTIKE